MSAPQTAIAMTVQAYNQLPAHLRKTVRGERFVWMRACEWVRVQFEKQVKS